MHRDYCYEGAKGGGRVIKKAVMAFEQGQHLQGGYDFGCVVGGRGDQKAMITLNEVSLYMIVEGVGGGGGNQKAMIALNEVSLHRGL